MDYLGTRMRGKFFAQILDTRPGWEITDRGRLIFSLADDSLYVGGVNSWIPCLIRPKSIKSSSIDWNINLDDFTDKVSAQDVPCLFDNNKINLQKALDEIRTQLHDICTGKSLNNNIINIRHINSKNDGTGFTAANLYFRDITGTLSKTTYNYNVEQALTILASRRADGILLALNNTFGSLLGFDSRTIQDGLVDLEQYINKIEANDINCQFFTLDYPNSLPCGSITIQAALDRIHSKFTSIHLNELVDVEKPYGTCGEVLKSCGVVHDQCCDFSNSDIRVRWGKVQASEVECKLINTWANTIDNIPYNTNMQIAIDWVAQHCVGHIPIGHVIISPMGIVEPGFLPCLGGFYNPITYPLLFKKIGYFFGRSADLFAVPNYYDVYVRGPRDNRPYHGYEPDQVGYHVHDIDMGVQPVSTGGEWAWADRQFSPTYQQTLGTGFAETKGRDRSALYVIRAF